MAWYSTKNELECPIQTIKSEIFKLLNFLKISMRNPKHDAKRKFLLADYRSLIHRKIDYRAIIHVCFSLRVISQIFISYWIHSLSLCIQAFPTTSIQSIYCEPAQLPPPSHRTLNSHKYLTSPCINNEQHPIKNRILPRLDSMIHNPIHQFISFLYEHLINIVSRHHIDIALNLSNILFQPPTPSVYN